MLSLLLSLAMQLTPATPVAPAPKPAKCTIVYINGDAVIRCPITVRGAL